MISTYEALELPLLCCFPHTRFILRVTAYAVLVFYVGWNLFHLSLLRIPTSLLVGLTGIPCPTTGGTRAMLALLQGDWLVSLAWNPLAIPIAVLGLLTVIELVRRRVMERRYRLPSVWLHVWIVVLSVSWLIQLWFAWQGVTRTVV